MKEQKNRKRFSRKSILCFLLAAMALCAAFSLLGDLIAWILQWTGGISFAVPKAATIGIIGGADGPTAIFVTASTGSVWLTIAKLLLLILCILGWRHLSRRK